MKNYETIVIVSGTSRGIGKCIAGHFLEKGYEVHGCSRSESAVFHDHYFHEVLDVSDDKSTTSWIRTISRSGKRIEILICNAAGIQVQSLLIGTTGNNASEILNTNIQGTMILCRETAKIMIRQKFGRIVTFSSIATAFHNKGSAIYAASKKAIEEMTKVMAIELASFGITCNCIAPGYVESPTVKNFGESFRESVIAQMTIKRSLMYDEISNAIDFLTSERNSIITGQVLDLGFIR